MAITFVINIKKFIIINLLRDTFIKNINNTYIEYFSLPIKIILMNQTDCFFLLIN